jgi:hypothetical protein
LNEVHISCFLSNDCAKSIPSLKFRSDPVRRLPSRAVIQVIGGVF